MHDWCEFVAGDMMAAGRPLTVNVQNTVVHCGAASCKAGRTASAGNSGVKV